MRIQSLLVPILLGAAAVAQVPVSISPAGGATALGNANNSIPFSWSPCTYQQVHNADSFSTAGPLAVNRMRMRMASGFANTPGATVDLELFFAQCPTTAATATVPYTNNIVAASEVNVYTRKMTALPTVPDNSWAVPFPFDAPFVWPNTNLSWRANIYGNSQNNAIFTYPLDAFSGSAGVATLGTGCRATNGTANTTHSTSGGALGGTLTFTGSSGIASPDPAFLLLGVSSTMWGAIPLPFDLTSLGATGCNLYTDIVTFVSMVTTPTGTISYPVPVPLNRSLTGQALLSEFLFMNSGANPLGAVTTNGRRTTFPAYVGATRLYGLSAPPNTGTTVGANFAMTIGLN